MLCGWRHAVLVSWGAALLRISSADQHACHAAGSDLLSMVDAEPASSKESNPATAPVDPGAQPQQGLLSQLQRLKSEHAQLADRHQEVNRDKSDLQDQLNELLASQDEMRQLTHDMERQLTARNAAHGLLQVRRALCIRMQLGGAPHCCTLHSMAGLSVELAAVFSLLEVTSELPWGCHHTVKH